MASSSRPLDKNIIEANGRLKLEWDAYFSRIESEVASLAAQIASGGVPSSRQIISGAGLTGGGDLSADRTLAIGQGTGIAVAADSISTNDAEIVHDNLSGFVADEHVAHSGVTLTAGAGLAGGGDITASRSFAVGAGTGITVNADDVAITAGGVGTTQLADEGVTMAKLEHAGAYTLLMRNAGTAGDPAYTKISALTDAGTFGSGDKLMIEESSGELRKIDFDDLPGGGGGSGAKQADCQIFTASGTWNKPSGYGADSIAFVRGWGGGGAGGKATTGDGAGGGGGGGYCEIWLRLADLGSSETVTIGAGGASQTSANTAGAAGANTTFGAHLTAYGGGGGGGNSAGSNLSGGGGGGAFGAGATGTTTGGAGGALGGGAGSNVNSSAAGASPSTFWGGAGGGGGTNGATNGAGGAAYLGGGGGGGGSDTGAGSAGGNSLYGGDGGAGATGATNATAGSAPGGGGGGAEAGNSGAGGDGRLEVTVFDAI